MNAPVEFGNYRFEPGSGTHYFPTYTEVVTKAAGAIARFLDRA